VTKLRVLLVDDDEKVLRLVEATLRLKDIEAVGTESAEQALHTLRAYTPDLVIADVALPDLDGLALLQRARHLPGLSDLPFLFLSSGDNPAVVKRGLAQGRTEFLRKPFAIDELLSRAQAMLRARQSAGRSPTGEVVGELTTTGLPDVLRMLVVQKESGTLTVEPRGVGAAGRIALKDGSVVYAEFGLLVGIDAVFALLLHDKGDYAFVRGAPGGPPIIVEATLPLLMEGYRLIDQGVLRRIDPREAAASRMFSHLVRSQRQMTPLASAEGASLPTGRTEVGLRSLDEFEDVGLNTEDFAPAFLTTELEAIEAELDDPAERTIGTIVVEALPDEGVTAVALIDDTLADLDVAAILGRSRTSDSADVMAFFEAVKAVALDTLGASAVQLGTRTGRVITSNIHEGVRRDTVAAFSREAIQFATKDPDGTQFASLDAGDLHVLVVEVDHLRLITLLFGSKPEPTVALAALKPCIEEYRAAR